MDLRPAPSEPALRELRKARRRNRVANLDWVDALYQAYVAAIAAGIALIWITGIVSADKVPPVTVARIADEGPAVVGAVLALCVALGLRGGGRGGPLALEEPEVTFVLLGPVDRGAALLGAAARQIRTGAFVGACTGAVVGLCALRRLPGNPVSWLACVGAIGLLAGAAFVGAALIASGRRWGPVLATLVGAALLALSVADIVWDLTLSPCTLAGKVAVWPLHFDRLGFVGLGGLLLLPLLGVYMCAGTSLEAAKRRAGLQAQLRFAATLYDIRTVILLRRQLNQEESRARPWLAGHSERTSFAVWRRGWNGFMRWPITRLVRLAVLGAVAGFACLGAWHDVKPLIVVAGGALFVAALDAVEPLAQENDHPHIRLSIPLAEGRLNVRHLAVPLSVMLVTCAFGVAVVLPFGDPRLISQIGIALVPSAALAAVCGAALSTLSEPPLLRVMQMGPAVDLMGIQMLFFAGWPPALAVIGVLPLLAAVAAPDKGLDPGSVAAASATFTLALSGLVVGWILVREQIKAARRRKPVAA